MFRTILAIAIVLGAWPAAGQTGAWKGPISGLLYDSPSRAIRPLIGFPGASYLGAALVTGIENASIAPGGEAALVIEGGRVMLIENLGGEGQRRTVVPGIAGRLEQAAWSPDSRVAVVYSPATRQLWRIETGNAAGAAAIDLPHLPGEVTSLAADAGARNILVSVRHAEEGGFYAVQDQGAARLIALANPGPVVFSRSAGGTFYAVDLETRQLLRSSIFDSGGWEPLTFAGEEERLAEPCGIALSRDEETLYVAGAAGRLIRAYNLAARSLQSEIQLAAAPNMLAELAGTASVYLLASREKPGQPVWILDARLAPAVFFVPAGE